MTMYQYRIDGAKLGYQRVLLYSTVGCFVCPDKSESGASNTHSDAARVGNWHREIVSDDVDERVEDGVTVTEMHRITRRFKVTKNGPTPRCKCGAPMVWRGWRVSLVDLKDGTMASIDGILFRDASENKVLWVKHAKTLKQRGAIIARVLRDGR